MEEGMKGRDGGKRWREERKREEERLYIITWKTLYMYSPWYEYWEGVHYYYQSMSGSYSRASLKGPAQTCNWRLGKA